MVTPYTHIFSSPPDVEKLDIDENTSPAVDLNLLGHGSACVLDRHLR